MKVEKGEPIFDWVLTYHEMMQDRIDRFFPCLDGIFTEPRAYNRTDRADTRPPITQTDDSTNGHPIWP